MGSSCKSCRLEMASSPSSEWLLAASSCHSLPSAGLSSFKGCLPMDSFAPVPSSTAATELSPKQSLWCHLPDQTPWMCSVVFQMKNKTLMTWALPTTGPIYPSGLSPWTLLSRSQAPATQASPLSWLFSLLGGTLFFCPPRHTWNATSYRILPWLTDRRRPLALDIAKHFAPCSHSPPRVILSLCYWSPCLFLLPWRWAVDFLQLCE